ncbi:MAG TPA: alpha/beta hydrolase [Bacillota bacterium]|nr:alpha/beta hydrolase [Bacillota bacterium]
MIIDNVKLYDKHVYDGCEDVSLDVFLHSPSKEMPIPPRPAMIVIGGGGYAMISDREREPISTVYLAAGYNVFQLNYSVAEKAPCAHPMLDIALAIATLRRNADEWYIDPEKIAVIGFSAGGHLAAAAATMFDSPEILSALGLTEQQTRPDAAILCYPVISAVDHPHEASFVYLLGNDITQEMKEKYSCERHVSKKTCPCFLFHTANDDCVPVQNSISFAKALADNGISFELHILPAGPHGISRATPETSWCPELADPYVARWSDWSVVWLNKLFHNE